MRLTKSQETVRVVFVLALLLGGLQFLVVYQWYQDLHVTNPGDLEASIYASSPRNLVTSTYPSSEESVMLYRRRVYRLHSERDVKETNMFTNLLHSNTDMMDGGLSPLRYGQDKFLRPPYQPLLYGRERREKGFLTIGIPSVRRPNTDKIYLFETLDSVIENIDADKHTTTVVVLLSDTNVTYNRQLSGRLFERYKTHCNMGFIRIIEAPPAIYPDFDKVRKTFNDDKQRIKWRTKQNIDFAYLCLYSKNISEFYIQLEDDVIAASSFVNDIRNYIEGRRQEWFLLEFSNLGFIGKLFHTSDLPWIADFLLTYFDLMPGDMLLGRMRFAKHQIKNLHSERSLFQHIGKFSSLKNKMMPSIDSQFKDAEKVNLSINVLPKGNNPPAEILTNLVTFEDHVPQAAYDDDVSTFFWSKSQKRHDYFIITFQKPHTFSRIIISTGDAKRKKDSLKMGSLLISKTIKTEQKTCEVFENYLDFIDGEVDTQAMGVKIPRDIVCMKILVTRSIRKWLIIRNIVLI